MERITRLLRQARKAVNGSSFVYALAFVEYDPERKMYIADPVPWDGKKESLPDRQPVFPEWWREEWDTEHEATDALNRLFESLGIPEKERVIFITDFGELE